MNPLAKMVFNMVMKQLFKKFDLNKINKYVNEENVLDKQMVHLQRKVNKQGRYIEAMEKDVAMLKKDTHPPVKGLEYRLEKLEEKK